ncbi:hypothetical protein WJX81_002172 [Elliptochloris bilobata]|uniref:Glucosidase II subunit alpha n=1 Tax=Elliptochloris bilobata TaxID=381761 RepID=A0AAW1RNN5_9CHLO
MRACAWLAIIALIPWTSGFKVEDFKRCSDSAFCTRLRGSSGEAYAVLPNSVAVAGSQISAQVKHEASGALFQLAITAYEGTVRLTVDEADPSVGRFHVPEVLLPELPQQERPWTKVSQTRSSLRASLGAAAVELGYSPLKLVLNVDGAPAVTFNADSMFAFEHRRAKGEEDPEGWWEEMFKGHRDSKPKGPEAISFDLAFPGVRHVYGLPQHASALALPPTTGLADNATSEPYRLYNLDVFEYAVDSPFGLYGSIPLLWAQRLGLTVAAFWLNAAEMYVDVEHAGGGVRTQWVAESGVLDLFLLLGPSPAEVSRQYARLTGTTAMPQEFALGYHQCRWNYRDEADVRAVDAGFDRHDIPYDVIWLDIEHTDGKRYFTWDAALFPEPEALQEDIASRGRRTVTIIDPHIKRDPGYHIYSEAARLDYFVKDRDGKEFDGWCWPGSSAYLDMLNPAARDWWAKLFQLDAYKGSTPHLYVWNDMNEPSVFNGPEITMHKDSLHFGGVEHRSVHNLYGALYHNATAQGLLERGTAVHGEDGDRPFVLSRAFFAGSQRIGPIWTGDNSATWEQLRISVPMLLSIGLAGLPFSGADVGGFFGNPEEELLVRWYQAGAFYPFFRGHAHLDTKRREPWLFGEAATERIRVAIRARYAMLPYLYTLFQAAHAEGLPIMRPLAFEFPGEAWALGADDAFMLGPGLLVAPVLEPGAAQRALRLPAPGPWYSATTGEAAAPGEHTLDVTLDSVPAYLRGGAILPFKERARRSTGAMARDPLTLVVALDAAGAAAGELYVDDGRSFAYRRGVFLHRRFEFAGSVLTSRPAPGGGGAMASGVTVERLVVLGLQPGREWGAQRDGAPLDVAPGPLLLRPGLPRSALVVRKLGLPLDADWAVTFLPGGAVA